VKDLVKKIRKKKITRRAGKRGQHQSLLVNIEWSIDLSDKQDFPNDQSWDVNYLLDNERTFFRDFLKTKRIPYKDEYLYTPDGKEISLLSDWETFSLSKQKKLSRDGVQLHYRLVLASHDSIAGARDAANGLLLIQKIKAAIASGAHTKAHALLLRMNVRSKRVLIAEVEPKIHAGFSRSRFSSEEADNLKNHYYPSWKKFIANGMSKSRAGNRIAEILYRDRNIKRSGDTIRKWYKD